MLIQKIQKPTLLLQTKIRFAIQDRNKEELIKQLTYFGNARNNETGTERMQMVEMFCSTASRAIISEIKELEDMPWDELSSSLGLPIIPEQKKPSPEEQNKPSPEELENAGIFIDNFVSNNKSLTSEAKELLVNKAKSKRGPWSVKDFVKSVTQNGRKITIAIKSGETYLYLE